MTAPLKGLLFQALGQRLVNQAIVAQAGYCQAAVAVLHREFSLDSIQQSQHLSLVSQVEELSVMMLFATLSSYPWAQKKGSRFDKRSNLLLVKKMHASF